MNDLDLSINTDSTKVTYFVRTFMHVNSFIKLAWVSGVSIAFLTIIMIKSLLLESFFALV